MPRQQYDANTKNIVACKYVVMHRKGLGQMAIAGALVIGVLIGAGLVFGALYATGSESGKTSTATTTITETISATRTLTASGSAHVTLQFLTCTSNGNNSQSCEVALSNTGSANTTVNSCGFTVSGVYMVGTPSPVGPSSLTLVAGTVQSVLCTVQGGSQQAGGEAVTGSFGLSNSQTIQFVGTITGPNQSLDGKPISSQVAAALYQASQVPYGTSGSAYTGYVQNYTGPIFSMNGKPILIYVGADYCQFCAVQRWPLIIALERFGNFSNLEYMASTEDSYATFTFSASSYQSPYLVFRPYELQDNAGNTIITLPSNYTTSFQQAGHSSYPFLNFADEYVISGSILSPSILDARNQTQIIFSIQAGTPFGSQIKQAANLITAIICKTTGDNPSSVCGQASISDTPISYNPSANASGPNPTYEVGEVVVHE